MRLPWGRPPLVPHPSPSAGPLLGLPSGWSRCWSHVGAHAHRTQMPSFAPARPQAEGRPLQAHSGADKKEPAGSGSRLPAPRPGRAVLLVCCALEPGIPQEEGWRGAPGSQASRQGQGGEQGFRSPGPPCSQAPRKAEGRAGAVGGVPGEMP